MSPFSLGDLRQVAAGGVLDKNYFCSMFNWSLSSCYGWPQPRASE